MTWIWQQKNWPRFIYEEMPDLHEKFVHNAGILTGLREALEPEPIKTDKQKISTSKEMSEPKEKEETLKIFSEDISAFALEEPATPAEIQEDGKR